jgi:hypothetical protein
MDLDVLKVLQSNEKTKISIVEIERSPFVRVKFEHQVIVMNKDEFHSFSKAVSYALLELNPTL